MQVFKAYLQIIRKNAGQLLMYLGIVTGLAIMMTVFNAQSPATGFAATKIDLAFFNNDTASNSAIVAGLATYLSEIADIKDVADDPEAITDAMFFGKISYVIRVPKGFGESFSHNGDLRLVTQAAPDSSASVFMGMLVNKYLNTVKLYRQGLPAADEAEIVRLTLANLAVSTPVEIKTAQVRQGSYDNIVYYFNYLAYALLSILILGVSTCMMTFNNIDLKRRNLCSPMTQRSLNLQLIAGNLVFSLFSWFVLVVVSLLLYRSAMFTPAGLMLVLNSLVFMMVGLSMSFLIGHTLRSRNAQAAVSNVLTLGTSFISGVFVPQAFLGNTVIMIARFTPTYWFVKANMVIGSLTSYKLEDQSDVFLAMLVQLLFAMILLLISFVVIRKKRQST